MDTGVRAQVGKAYQFAMGGLIAKLALVTSILSIVRLGVDLFTLPQSAVLAKSLAAYRTVFHAPLNILESLLHLAYVLTPAGKDAVLLYTLCGFLYQRVVWRQIRFNYAHPWYIQHRSRNNKAVFFLQSTGQLLAAILFWPLRLRSIAKEPYLVVGLGGHGPSALSFLAKKPQTGERAAYFGDARLIMIVRLGATLLGAVIVVATNYALV